MFIYRAWCNLASNLTEKTEIFIQSENEINEKQLEQIVREKYLARLTTIVKTEHIIPENLGPTTKNNPTTLKNNRGRYNKIKKDYDDVLAFYEKRKKENAVTPEKEIRYQARIKELKAELDKFESQ